MITLRPDQQQLKSDIYREWTNGARVVLAQLATGGGKCLGRDTPILMFDGSIKMSQDILMGDVIMGPDSKARLVVATTTGEDDLYRVTPRKGDAYVVNSKHVLSLRRTAETTNPKWPCQMRAGEIVNLPVTEYLSQTKWFKHIHKGWRSAVDFLPAAPLPIEPYFVGLWLGDGASRHPTITTMDTEVHDYVVDYANRLGMRVRIEQAPNNRAWNIHVVQADPAARKKTVLREFLKSNDLLLNKHIPLAYKTASRADRLALLAGMLDSDGHYDGKSFDVIFKSERLMDDLLFLARSLGFSAYKSKCRKTCTNNNVTGDYYRCSINGDLDIIPTKIKRQQARPRQQKKNVLNVGIEVEHIGRGEYYGFQIYGIDHLFMLGDFTVTHNSVITSDIILDGHSQGMNEVVMAHRNELVSQMSMHVARRHIPHRIIGSKQTVAAIVKEHRREFGQSFVNPDARCAVGSVQTIVSRADELRKWGNQIHRFTGDEGHHFLRANTWGKAVELFPNARGLLVTACTQRADGAGLGSHAEGIADALCVGPPMRELIDIGALCDYEIIIPTTDYNIGDDAITAKGDFSPVKMREASKKSHIVSDAVTEYRRWIPGKRAICFATDVETSNDIAARFNEAGISAASVSAKTDDGVRQEMIRRFKDGRLLVLVNVDLFDEGFDVPGCDAVIMARPTASLNKYLQMFGRALRTAPGKLVGTIIDLVSNVMRHGFPDKPHIWTLDRRDKRSKREPDPDDIPLTACRSCSRPYERCLPACPYCGEAPPVPEGGARSIEQVDGDLMLLDRATLAAMRAAMQLEAPGDVAERVGAVAGPVAAAGAVNRQMERHAAQERLRAAVEQWAGVRRAAGESDQSIYRRFYLTCGVDVLSAMAGKRAEMDALAERVRGWYENA